MTEEAEAHKARDTRDTHDARDTPVTAAAEAEVADICRDLIRIDTTNPGDHSGPGERAAAEYVAGLLGEVGLEPTVLESRKPARDVVLAFTADEEAGGTWGAAFLTRHPDLFEGVTEAIGEVGGFSVSVGGRRMYTIQTAEKGLAWMRLSAAGTAGHGSMIHPDNAVTALTEAVARIGRHEWPVRLPDSARAFLEAASAALGVEFDPEDPGTVIGQLGSMGRLIGATVQNTANPTGLKAGYKVNVIPQSATAEIDGRFLPGHEEEFFKEIDRLLGSAVKREFIHHDIALETTADGALYDSMTAALLAEDPQATVVPYCLSAGTDAKWFSKLGIRCFGFSPLKLTPDLDFSGMFHGIDERVPVDGLRFGVRVLDRFLDIC